MSQDAPVLLLAAVDQTQSFGGLAMNGSFSQKLPMLAEVAPIARRRARAPAGAAGGSSSGTRPPPLPQDKAVASPFRRTVSWSLS
jgi:hypothetical protein